MLRTCTILLTFLLLSACNRSAQEQSITSSPTTTTGGEFAFLLNYDGKLPADVGFLTNHVVERRLANLLKDHFQHLAEFTACAKPIKVNKQLIIARFVSCTDTNIVITSIAMDVSHDALWVQIPEADSMRTFTDNSELPVPF